MNILALDCSKVRTGWAAGDGRSAPRSGSFGSSGRNRGEIAASFARSVRALLSAEAPALVVIEAPFLRSGKNAGSAETMRLLIGLTTMAEACCSLASVPHIEVAASTWRKAFIGHGRPSNPKAASIAMCRLLRWPVGADDNRADACGIWTWAHLTRGEKRTMHSLLSASSLTRMETTNHDHRQSPRGSRTA